MSSAISPRPLNRIAALKAEQQAMLALARSLTDEEWRTPSAAPDWRVQEVIAHMAAACHGMFNPMWTIKALRSTAIERSNDDDAEARRHLAPADVLAEYERWSPRFVRMSMLTAKTPGADQIRIPLGELGRFPAPMMASAFVFDHWTHLAHDITPVLDRPEPTTDDNRMGVVVEWILAGFEQMCRTSMGWLDQPVGLTLDGAGGGSWLVRPVGDGLLQVRPGNPGDAPARVRGRSADLPVWSTTRRSWRDCDVTVGGDEELAARFLDTINIV